jgi:hypothetical protein
MHGRREKCIQHFLRKPEDRDHSDDLGVDGLIILKLTSDPDDDDRDGHRNVGTIRTPNAADSPRILHQILKLMFEKYSRKVWTGLIWLWIETCGGLL